MQAERTAQSGLKEKITALEREIKSKVSEKKCIALRHHTGFSTIDKEQIDAAIYL